LIFIDNTVENGKFTVLEIDFTLDNMDDTNNNSYCIIYQKENNSNYLDKFNNLSILYNIIWITFNTLFFISSSQTILLLKYEKVLNILNNNFHNILVSAMALVINYHLTEFFI